MHRRVETIRGPMHRRVETPWGPMHWGVAKVDLLKLQIGPMHWGVKPSLGSYAPESHASRCPMYWESQLPIQNVEEFLWHTKIQIDSIKIEAYPIQKAEEFSRNKENLC